MPARRAGIIAIVGALAIVALGSACSGDRGSDITVAYRGDLAAYRQLVTTAKIVRGLGL